MDAKQVGSKLGTEDTEKFESEENPQQSSNKTESHIHKHV